MSKDVKIDIDDLQDWISSSPDIAGVTSTKGEDGDTILETETGYFKETFYTNSIFDEKDFKKFVKAIERLVRRSNEYSSYIGYLKNDLEMTTCSFLNNIDDEKAAIEFHHYPFTLYDIVSIVMEDMLMKKTNVSSFKVAERVMDLHFNNLIGLVPVSVTVHELIHAGEIFVNLKQVFGDYYKFIDMYKSTLNPLYLDKFNELVELSNDPKMDYSNRDILSRL